MHCRPPLRAPASRPSPDVRLYVLPGLAFGLRPHPVPPGVMPGSRKCLGAWHVHALELGTVGVLGSEVTLGLGIRGGVSGGGRMVVGARLPPCQPLTHYLSVDVPVLDTPCEWSRVACVSGVSR